MQFPSLQKLASAALSVVKRFPFEILSALTASIAATVNVELKYFDRGSENIYLRIIMAAELALLLSFAATLFSEAKKLDAPKKLMLRLAAVFLAVILFFLIHPGERQSDYVRFFLLALGFHLLVAFAAFTGKNLVHAFWQFNKTSFMLILTAVLYSVVLFLGISAAISATNFLFGFKFEWDTYAILWIWIAGVFNTTFFLAGVPDNFEPLEQDYSYPKGLKLFTQYVLIPLASIYVLILLAYEIKILLAWNLPKGLVSNLILSYAVFGILSLLLVYPIRNLDENKWLKSYSRYFYFLLIPLLLLLFAAVGTRVLHYGITEKRYFLIALAFWLLLITVYFLISKKQNIKLIPISLCIVTLLAIYGPQSAFAVAEQSQRIILVRIFKKYHAVFNGKISRLPTRVSAKDGNRAAAALEYLIKNHDFSSIQSLVDKNLQLVEDSLDKQNSLYSNLKINNYELKQKKLDWAKTNLGLEKFLGNDDEYEDKVAVENTAFKINYIFPINEQLTDLKGYDYMINASSSQDSLKFNIGPDQIIAIQNFQTHQHMVKINQLKFDFDATPTLKYLLEPKFNLSQYLESGKLSQAEHYNVPPSDLSIIKKAGDYTVKFQISNLSYSKTAQGVVKIQNIQGNYLIKKNN